MKTKLTIVVGILITFTGCTISDEECKNLGYTHGIHNGFEYQIGCARIEGNIVHTYNHARDEYYIQHIEEAGMLYKLK